MSSQEQASAAVALIQCLKQVSEKYDLDYDELADRVMENKVDPEDIQGTVEAVAVEMKAPFVPTDHNGTCTDVDS